MNIIKSHTFIIAFVLAQFFSFELFAQKSSDALLNEIKQMPSATIDFVYHYRMKNKTPFSIKGTADIQGNSYRLQLADGSCFCSDGTTLWHLYSNELVISELDSTCVSPYNNMTNFLEASTLSTNKDGNRVLSLTDDKEATHILELLKIKSKSKRVESYFVFDTESCSEDIYINDLR